MLFCLRGNEFGSKDSLVRGFGRIVAFDNTGANALFGLKFYGGHEEVVKEPPLVFVEVI